MRTALNANGFSSVGAARFFINGLDTTTQGVDVVGTYRFGLGGFGNWSLSAAYNYTKNKIDKRLNNLGPLATNPEHRRCSAGSRASASKRASRKDKVVLSADGSIGGFGVTGAHDALRLGDRARPRPRRSAYPTSLTAIGPDDVFLKPKWITDFAVRYTFKTHATLCVRRGQRVRRLSRPACRSARGRRRSAGSIRPTRSTSRTAASRRSGSTGGSSTAGSPRSSERAHRGLRKQTRGDATAGGEGGKAVLVRRRGGMAEGEGA